jgi:hypothetical protein
MSKKQFIVTDEHLQILKMLNVDYDRGPEIDRKRPYGNTDYQGDILKAVGEKQTESSDGDEFWTKEQGNRADKIHREAGMALQIALCTGTFEAGTYEQQKPYHSNSWARVPDKPLSPEAQRAKQRPSNYNQMPSADQWAIDKQLGILDWDGS